MFTRITKFRKQLSLALATLASGCGLAWWLIGPDKSGIKTPTKENSNGEIASIQEKSGGIRNIEDISVTVIEPPPALGDAGKAQVLADPPPPDPTEAFPSAVAAKMKSPPLPGLGEFRQERTDLIAELTALLDKLAPLTAPEKIERLNKWRADNSIRLRKNREKAVLYKELCIDDYPTLTAPSINARVPQSPTVRE
jgi:hypothetical protein